MIDMRQAGIGALLIVGLLVHGLGRADEQPPSKRTAPSGIKKSESVASVKATAGALDADGKQRVTIVIDIDKKWHIYANPVPKDFPGLPTTVSVEGKTKPIEMKVDYPAGKVVKDSTIGDYTVYEDKVEIKALVKRAKDDTGPLNVSVDIQACSDTQCLLPSTIKVTVP